VFECLILGDSIAVGTHMFAQQCEMQAKGGINTHQFNSMFPGKFTAKIVVISLGSNDHQYVRTRAELEATRSRVEAGAHVLWVLPAGNLKASNVPIESIQQIVRDIAVIHGDTVLPIVALQSDGIHPSTRGYKDIVSHIK
jgi:hypothetical protein